MKNNTILLVGFILFGFTQILPTIAVSERHHEFDVIWEKEFILLRSFDFNQDGTDELMISYENQLDVQDIFLTDIFASKRIPIDRKYGIIPLATGRFDSLCFLFHYATKDSSVFLLYRTVDYEGRESREFLPYFSFTGVDRDSNGIFHRRASPLTYLYNQDHQKLLLFHVNSNYDISPRGLIAVAPETGKIVWEFDIGPFVIQPIIVDFDNDGTEEIVMGSYSVGNRAFYNGTGDDSSYVFLINADGELIWRRTIGGVFSGVRPVVGNFTSSDQKDLVVFFYNKNHKVKRQDELIRLAPSNGQNIKTAYVGQRLILPSGLVFYPTKADFNNDGLDELVVGNSDGFVRMFDGELKVVETSRSYRQKIEVHAVADFTGNGRPEVLCRTCENELVMLDYQLNHLAAFTVPAFNYIQILHTKQKTYVLCVSPGSANFQKYTLLELRTRDIPPETINQARKIFFWGIILLVILMSLLYIRHFFFGRSARRLLYSFLESAGLAEKALILDSKGRIRIFGDDWEQALNTHRLNLLNKRIAILEKHASKKAFYPVLLKILDEKLPENQIDVQAGKQNYRLQATWIRHLRLFCILLIDRTEAAHVRYVKAWAPIAQRLAHSIKNPLTTIKLNAEDLLDMLKEEQQLSGNDTAQALAAIVDQAEKLTKMSDGFMRLVRFEVPTRIPVDLNALIRELIPQWQPRNPNVQVNFELQSELSKVLFDKAQLSSVLKCLFFNALDSLDGTGKIIISTKEIDVFNDSGGFERMIELVIRDTGCGISKEYVEKIFQPFFSLKKSGTGLGLNIVQNIMNENNGSIHLESEEGVGTTVTLRFQKH